MQKHQHRSRQQQERRTDKRYADQFGLPKAFRRYTRQYGSNIIDLIATHRQNRAAPTLNQAGHARTEQRRLMSRWPA